MERKHIPTKNYIIVLGLIVLVLCACLAAFNIYKAYEENSIKTSPLDNQSVLYTDFKTSTKEINADTFFVISYTRDVDVNKNEKAIYKSLKKKNLLDNVLYLDVTEYKDGEDVVSVINNNLKLKDGLEVKQIPALVFYKDGVAVKTVDSREHLLSSDDFDQIIDEYQLAS